MIVLYFLIFFNLVVCEVEVSSDAAAAVKQNFDGKKQTFISSQSKAKTLNENGVETAPEEANTRSGTLSAIHSPYGDTLRAQKVKLCVISAYAPDKWSDHYPLCGGKRQSPIPVQAEPANNAGKLLSPLKLTTYQRDGLLFGSVVNNGHSFGMNIDESRSSVNITGGPLSDAIFALNQFHFHYSCDTQFTGSEHTLDGLKYAGELHLVFYNTKYENLKSAMDKSDGLAVMGFFIKKMKDGADNFNYVYYQGSLTTPPLLRVSHMAGFPGANRRPLKRCNCVINKRFQVGDN
ncbi:Carbonic anhydrase 2 [Thelohanellus kitauei]|uniref:Carbonic anhydrase n=1 Tax=Thelohanellus kitauei TaxID=669202 RepID=A0A0C2NGV0_THEKT|nr:Carbonic anhydrase 2 [Thelohanellus kitauei]